MPLIDVILPAYNHCRFLNNAINAILSQDFNDFKLIIVNDGSKDDTYDYLENIKTTDNRILVAHHDPNMGLPTALNTGHALGDSKLCTWVSADNIHHPNFLSELYETLTSGNHDFVQSLYTTIENNQRTTRDIRTLKDNWGMGNLCPSFLYKREIWDRFGYDEELECLEDLKFYLQAYLSKYDFGFVEKNLMDYYLQDDSLTIKVVWKDLAKHNEKLQYLYETVVKPFLITADQNG